MLAVTGSLGFVGTHLSKLLRERGIPFVGYDLLDGDDIRDLNKLDAFFERNQVTEVIHLAALAGVRRGEEYPDDYISTNIRGTMNVIKMCEKYKVTHLISYSSSSVYGEGKPPTKETSQKKPVSVYGMTKLMGELLVERAKIPQRTIIIPFTIYGENGRKDEVVFKWLEQYKNNLPITVFGDGSSERGYVNVHDLIKSTVDILQKHKGHWDCMHFNLGGSEIIRLSDLVSLFQEELPDLQIKKMKDQKGDVHNNYADTSKAKKMIDFDPAKNFISNVRSIIKSEAKKYVQT